MDATPPRAAKSSSQEQQPSVNVTRARKFTASWRKSAAFPAGAEGRPAAGSCRALSQERGAGAARGCGFARLLMEHDLFGKPLHPFPDHALPSAFLSHVER